MDLLSRLIAGSSATSPTKQKLNTPAERLSACKRICAALQQIWRNGTRLSDDKNASKHVAGLLARLNTILHDESRKAAPHSCLLYTASTQIYIITTKLALSCDSSEIISATAHFFHLLINGEVEGVLDSKIFARALIDLVRRSTIFSTIVVDEQGEADLVELLFEIATKIRLDPDILPGWFYPERDPGRNKNAGSEARRSQFPLFYLLVDYVHHDGPKGDFARTGLLYLTEAASQSNSLEKWMIESDLAPQMASGLSALYSRLSRHAPTMTDSEKALPIIASSDNTYDIELVANNDDDYQQSVNAFLSYLAFWQDTLNHCKSIEVRDTLLDHFQVLFVQQLLYPSLLESSDVAGGSTAAVILHLYRMLDAIDYQLLTKRMLNYLLASPDLDLNIAQPKHNRSRMSISRRNSMDKLATFADLANTPSPDLFNLYDLLVISLHSKNTQTVNACLKLMTMITHKHHPLVLSQLLHVQTIDAASNQQSLHDFNESLMILFDLATNIAHIDTADVSYEAAINDNRLILEQHSCLTISDTSGFHGNDGQQLLIIRPDCKLFNAILALMESFFQNDTVTNITLTEFLVAIASCEHILLRSWVLPAQSKNLKDTTALQDIITELVNQVKIWKSSVPEWDSLFAYQRSLLDGYDEGPSNVINQTVSDKSASSSFQQSPRLAPISRPSTPVRASTPRGRKIPPPTFTSIDSALALSPTFPASPTKAVAGSPLHQSSFPGEISAIPTRKESLTPSVSTLTLLKQQMKLPIRPEHNRMDSPIPQLAERLKLESSGSGFNTPLISAQTSGVATPVEITSKTTATLSHVLTNAIILQEFIFEMAALLHIRSALFDEVDVS